MVKLVMMHKADSIYDDEPDRVYDFPRRYLSALAEAVGDWVIYYEPVKAGPRGYFAVACINQILPKPGHEGRFLALIRPGSYLPFDREVPRLVGGRPMEDALMAPDGTALSGGLAQSAVRRMSEADFARIIDLGLPADLERTEAARYDPVPAGLAEDAAPVARPIVERLTARPYRDLAFRRRIRTAYDNRCALSGLQLRNGGGRPEVEAAHIRPVAHGGSDAIGNGLALSGTLHWMFDRGLISVAEDHAILVSRNKVPPDIVRRLLPDTGRLHLPGDRRHWPHPDNLRWHRENVYGQALSGTPPWRDH